MRLFLITIVLFLSFNSYGQSLGGKTNIIGADIRTANPFWKNYAPDIQAQRLEKIRIAIRRNVGNLNLLEHSFVLDQLCELLKLDSMRLKWSQYILGLNKRDPLVLLSAEFFRSTLDINRYLEKDYSVTYKFIKESLSTIPAFILNDRILDSLITQRGFSEVVGEGEIFAFLVIDHASALRVIRANPKLQSRYETWLNNLSDDAYGFWFSDSRPSEMFVRESRFLIKQLNESDLPLSQKSASAIDEMKIVRIHPNKNGYPLGYPDDPTDSDLLIGTWFGPYNENKKIIFRILKLNGKKVEAQSKMQGQDDTQLVSCEGNYSEAGKKFKLILKEPTDKPFNGAFELEVDRFTLDMQGKWISYNNQLSRNFKIKKNPLVPEH